LASSSSFLDDSLKDFLDAVPARTPAPGGGAVAAVVAALAAGLTAMAARFAPDEWERRAEVVGRTEELRARLEPLADADADAYAAFMAERSPEAVERIVALPFELAEVPASSPGSRLSSPPRGTRTSPATPPPAPTWPRRPHPSPPASSRSTR